MNIPTCYRCPLRPNCDILAAKKFLLKGLDLTTVKFRCDVRKELFTPGQPVAFKGYDVVIDQYGCERRELEDFEGWVWKLKGRKWLVVSDQTDAPVVTLWADAITPIDGEMKRCCVHCGKPEGVATQIKSKGETTLHTFVCRSTYTEYVSTDFPCEYATEVGGQQ